MKRVWVGAIPILILILGVALLRKREVPRTPKRGPVERTAVEVAAPEPAAPSPAIPAPREDVPVASEAALAESIRDSQDHELASDAVGLLARYPTEAAVDQFRKLLGESEPYLVRLRALQGLLLMIAWTPRDADALRQARAVLLSDGRAAAGLIERDSGIAAFRHEARLIRNEIEMLTRVRE